MTTPQISRIADSFWEMAGEREQFPRSLEPAAYWALPLGIFKLPRLWVSDAQSWLDKRDMRVPFSAEDRPLHGCLIAGNGRGLVLLNGTDDPSELRYSLAHEIAHFLLDYHLPRERAVKLLGPDVLDVFDGRRPPTVGERVHATLNRVPIGFHVHFMNRNTDGGIGCGTIGQREESADSLALELLAPEKEARQRIHDALRDSALDKDNENVARAVLQGVFGLPPAMAAIYGTRLLPHAGPSSVREWLRT